MGTQALTPPLSLRPIWASQAAWHWDRGLREPQPLLERVFLQGLSAPWIGWLGSLGPSPALAPSGPHQVSSSPNLLLPTWLLQDPALRPLSRAPRIRLHRHGSALWFLRPLWSPPTWPVHLPHSQVWGGVGASKGFRSGHWEQGMERWRGGSWRPREERRLQKEPTLRDKPRPAPPSSPGSPPQSRLPALPCQARGRGGASRR